MLVAGIVEENIGGQTGQATQTQLITQTDDLSGILVGPFLGDLIVLAQLLDEQRGGNIRVQRALLGKVGRETDGLFLQNDPSFQNGQTPSSSNMA